MFFYSIFSNSVSDPDPYRSVSFGRSVSDDMGSGPPEPDQGRRVRRPSPPQGERRLPLEGVIGWSFLQILLKVYVLLDFGLNSKYSLYEKTLQNI